MILIKKEYSKLSTNKNYMTKIIVYYFVESNCANKNIAVYNITMVNQIQD